MNSNKSLWDQAWDNCVEKTVRNHLENISNSANPTLWKPLDISGFCFEEDDIGNLKFTWNHERTKRVEVKKVIFNPPATIVFWSDGTKTVVRANNEPFDSEKGLAMAIAKKFLGNKGNYYDTFKKYIKWGATDDQRGKH